MYRKHKFDIVSNPLSNPVPMRFYAAQDLALTQLSKKRGMAKQEIVRSMIDHCLRNLIQQ